jgi:hypothetical protein
MPKARPSTKQNERSGRSEGKVSRGESPKNVQQLVRSKVFLVLKILSPVFACGLLIGYGLGKHWSRDYENRTEIAKHVAANVVPANKDKQIEYEEQYNEVGRPLGIEPKDSGLVFECEITSYRYSPGKPIAQVGNPRSVPKTHRRYLDFDGAVALLYGSVEGLKFATQFPKFVESVEGLTVEQRLEFYTYGLIAFASGIALGVELGYDDSPDCTSKTFSENLASEPFWQTVYAYYMENHSIFFIYGDLGFPQVDKSRGIAAILASKKREDIIRALEARPQFTNAKSESIMSDTWSFDALEELDKGHIPRFWILENQLIRVDPREEFPWELTISSWAKRHGPVAARILLNKRFKGDVMVVLRRWTIDEHDHITSFDFTSSLSTQDPIRFDKELESLGSEESDSYLPIEKSKLLDMKF